MVRARNVLALFSWIWPLDIDGFEEIQTITLNSRWRSSVASLVSGERVSAVEGTFAQLGSPVMADSRLYATKRTVCFLTVASGGPDFTSVRKKLGELSGLVT